MNTPQLMVVLPAVSHATEYALCAAPLPSRSARTYQKSAKPVAIARMETKAPRMGSQRPPNATMTKAAALRAGISQARCNCNFHISGAEL